MLVCAADKPCKISNEAVTIERLSNDEVRIVILAVKIEQNVIQAQIPKR